MPIKLVYLVKRELTLIKLIKSSLSRKIRFPDGAIIMEFGFKGSKAGLQYLVVGI